MDPTTNPRAREGGLRLDAAFEALSHRYRRHALYRLEGDDPVPVEALADAVADRTDGRPTAEVRVELEHAHLPKLEDLGVVAVEDERVRLEALPEPLESTLDLAARREDGE